MTHVFFLCTFSVNILLVIITLFFFNIYIYQSAFFQDMDICSAQYRLATVGNASAGVKLLSLLVRCH